jgi:sec-independent protein translocase protein TatA
MGEIVVILVLVLIFFGPSKLPQLGESLGKAIRGFKQASSEPEERPARAHRRLAGPVEDATEAALPAAAASEHPAAAPASAGAKEPVSSRE